jgi:hypothetical protein
MPEDRDYRTTILSLTGKDHHRLHFLANLSPLVDDPDSIWSVVADLTHRPEVRWTRRHFVQSWLTSMDETPSGSLFAVSIDGELHFAQDNAWTKMDLGCPEGLYAIWAGSDRDLFAVGGTGLRVSIHDLAPHVDRDAKRRRLFAIHGASCDDVYAVGQEGVVFRRAKGMWTEIEAPTDAALLAVLCQGESVYVGGERGTLLRRTSETWEPLRCPEEIAITSLAWYRATLFAAAGLKGVYRLGPDGLESFKQRTVYKLRTVGHLLFGIGGSLVMQYDGSGWWGGELDL